MIRMRRLMILALLLCVLIGVTVHAEGDEANTEKELFAPRVGQAAIVTAGVTVGLIAIGAAIAKKKGR